MRESTIESYLRNQVIACGGEVRKVGWIGRRGAPDRLVLLPGRPAIYVELKAPGKRPRIAQTREHERLRALGQWVEVIDSHEGVDQLLEQLR
jgi:hypothetical protein